MRAAGSLARIVASSERRVCRPLSEPQRVARRVAAGVIVEIREDRAAFAKAIGEPCRPLVQCPIVVSVTVPCWTVKPSVNKRATPRRLVADPAMSWTQQATRWRASSSKTSSVYQLWRIAVPADRRAGRLLYYQHHRNSVRGDVRPHGDLVAQWQKKGGQFGGPGAAGVV
jgi:hypothetical protein